MINYSYAYFLNQFKLGTSGRRYYFDAHISSSVKPLVRLLQRLNIIRRFYKLSTGTSMYRIMPTYSRHHRYARRLKLYTRVNGRTTLTYAALRILDFNTPHSHYILETSKGIMTHKDAIKLRTGGQLLVIAY